MLELIREACHNAIQHGDARDIRIHLSVDDNRNTALVTVTNDGERPPDNPTPGLESAFFDDLAVSWERRVGGRGVEVLATIPSGDH